MNLSIKKILKGGNRKHILLIAELFFSFIAFFIILAFIITSINNARTPLGFSYNNVHSINLQIPNIEWDTIKKTIPLIHEYLKNYPEVENTGEMYCSNLFIKGFMNPHESLKYNNMEFAADKIELMGANDNMGEILDINMIKGRWFNREDDGLKNRPCIINRKLKEHIFGNNKAIGEIIDYCDQKCIVVGICDDFKHKGDYSIAPFIFIVRHTRKEGLAYETSYCMSGSNCGFERLIRFKENAPPTIEEDISGIVFTRFPGYTMTFNSLNKRHVKYVRQTWIPLLSVFLVVLFLFLNVLFGLFGVLWYNISLRKSEIGLRMAVGASKRNIKIQFVGELLALATLGIIPGVIIAIQFPILRILNIENAVYIMAIIAAVVLIYLLVTLCALIPSAQAGKIQPAMALHEQ